MNASIVISRVIPLLHAPNAANLAVCLEADLYTYLSDSLRRTCQETAIIGAAVTISVAASSNAVSLPAKTLAVLDAAWNGDTINVRTTRQMDASRNGWRTETGPAVKNIVFDGDSFAAARLHPAPTAGGSLQLVITQVPDDQTSSSTTLYVPDLVAVIGEMETVAQARGGAGLHTMPETADGLQQMTGILRDALTNLYGRAM